MTFIFVHSAGNIMYVNAKLISCIFSSITSEGRSMIRMIGGQIIEVDETPDEIVSMIDCAVVSTFRKGGSGRIDEG